MASSSNDMPTLNLDEENSAEYKNFIKCIIEQFTKPVVDKHPLPLVKEVTTEYQFKDIGSEIDKCFELSVNERNGDRYEDIITAEIGRCFQKPAPPLDREDAESKDTFPRVSHRTYLQNELISSSTDKSQLLNWVFQVRLRYEQVNLDILIKKDNLYLVGYKGKCELIKEEVKVDRDDLEKKDGEMVENWILLEGLNLDKVVKSVNSCLDKNGNPIKPREAKLGTSYHSLFGKSDSTYTEDVRKELIPELYMKLKGKLLNSQKQQEQVEKRKNYVEKKLKELPQHATIVQNLINWLPKYFGALEAEANLEKEGTKVRSLRNFLADEVNKSSKSSKSSKSLRAEYIAVRAEYIAVNKLAEMKKEWEKKAEIQLNEQIISMNYLLDWLPKMNIARKASDLVDNDATFKNFRNYLQTNLEKLQSVSITAEKLIKQLDKYYRQVKNEAGTSERKSDPDELLFTWVKEFEKAVDIWNEVKNEWERKKMELDERKKMVLDERKKMELDEREKMVKHVADKLDKKYVKEKEGEELKMELAAVIKLVKKLKKEFSREKEVEELKKDESALLELIEHFADVRDNKDRLEFYQELKRESDTLKATMKKLKVDAYSNVVRRKTGNLRLNRNALICAFKHLTEKPFEEDGDSAKHIIILIQMICEATRFRTIADHISDNYTNSDENTAFLTEKDIALQHKWTEGSNIIARGEFYPSENPLWEKDDLPSFTVSRGRNEQQSWEE